MLKTLICFLSFLFSFSLLGQEFTSYNWFFGENAGVDFNYGVPTVVSGGQTQNWEGVATIGDNEGNLVFYTNGMSVWNKQHQVMLNGTGLMGHTSATQSSIIVPCPASTHLFYIFTTDAIENSLANGLRYSVVDITLDNGLGGITSVKNVLLEPSVCEKIVAIEHENSQDIWVVTHRWNSNQFLAYQLSNQGIDTVPVVSSIGVIHQGGGTTGYSNSAGYLKANLSGDKIAVATHRMGIIELFDFDNALGTVTNCISSTNTFLDVYGLEFSPNSNYLYASTIYTGSKLYQFDLSSPNPFLSPTLSLLSPSNMQISGMQIAPDGEIYVAERFSAYLSVIHCPNQLGANCDFETNAIYLNGATCHRGLPPSIDTRFLQFATGSLIDTSVCESDSFVVQNGYATVSGMYYDTLTSIHGWDSIVNIDLTVLQNPAIPVIDDILGVLTTDPGFSYQWYYYGTPILGAVNNTFDPQNNGSGEYQVEITNASGCSSVSDVYSYLLEVTEMDVPSFEFYPNPCSGMLYFEGLNGAIIQFVDVLGNSVLSLSTKTSKTEINTENLPEGTYVVRVVYQNKIFCRKLIILN